jgi:hypothetical protein
MYIFLAIDNTLIYCLDMHIRTTQHYAKILDKKVSEDMQVLRDKFKINPVGLKIKVD